MKSVRPHPPPVYEIISQKILFSQLMASLIGICEDNEFLEDFPTLLKMMRHKTCNDPLLSLGCKGKKLQPGETFCGARRQQSPLGVV